MLHAAWSMYMLLSEAERNEEQRLLASSVRKAKEAFDNAAAGKELSLEAWLLVASSCS